MTLRRSFVGDGLYLYDGRVVLPSRVHEQDVTAQVRGELTHAHLSLPMDWEPVQAGIAERHRRTRQLVKNFRWSR